MRVQVVAALGVLAAASAAVIPAAAAPKPVKVFVLAGQSHMEGKAKVSLLESQAAQPTTTNVAEFRGNVALVPTDVFWDWEADAVFRKGCREPCEVWDEMGSDYPCHYLGSAKTPCAIG